MKRFLMAALLVAFAGTVSVRADDKKDEKPKDRAEQLKELKEDFQKAIPDVVKEWRAASSDDAREKALGKLDPLIQRGYKIVEADPKDKTSMEALRFLIGTRPEPTEKVLKLIATHHVNDPVVRQLLQQFAGSKAESVHAFLKTVIEKADAKDVKGIATYALAQGLHAQAEEAKTPQAAAKLDQEAEALLDKVSKEFGDATFGRDNLKKAAEKTLFEIRNLSIGKNAPEVVSRDLDEKEAKLSALKGKVVVLDIWATWCGPCRAMIPHEREMVEKLKDKPFVLVSVSADEKKETLKEFLEKEKMPWTHWWEGRRDGGIINDWNVRFFPTIYVIDHKGVIRHKGLRGAELEKAVEKLIEEAEKKS